MPKVRVDINEKKSEWTTARKHKMQSSKDAFQPGGQMDKTSGRLAAALAGRRAEGRFSLSTLDEALESKRRSANLEGYIAHTGGVSLTANPYLGSPLWFEWNNGWMRGRSELAVESFDDGYE